MRKIFQTKPNEKMAYWVLGVLVVMFGLWAAVICAHVGFEVWVETLRMAGVVSSVEEAFRAEAASWFHTLIGFVLVFGKVFLVTVLLALTPIQVCRLGGFVSVGKRLFLYFKKEAVKK